MPPHTQWPAIHLDPELHIALRLKAVETSRSVSDLINDAIRGTLSEDAEDIGVYGGRATEPLIGYDEMLKRLKNHGRI